MTELDTAHVAAYLEPQGHTVRYLEADTSTAVLAARALDTEVGSIVKSLVFIGQEPVIVLVSGDRSVDRSALATELQADTVKLAKPQEVLALTGFAVGGVPPVAHLTPLPVMFDRHLFRFPVVHAAAGSPNAIFSIDPHELWMMTTARITDATT